MSAISKYSNYSQFQQCNSKLNAMIAFDKSGTPGQIIGSDGTNGLIWTDSDPSSASYWSEYPATQTVDIANNDIENVNNLTADKIKIDELSFVSAFPIGIEVAFDENTFTTGILAQNKDSADASSVSILLTNNLGTDSAYYGGLTMFSSNTVPAYGFPSMKNAISLNSQSSSVVISPWNGQQDGTADENGNIMLTYNGGSKAHIINNNGQLILGADNPDFSGSTYGGDNGGTDNVLTSDGTNGLKWITPEYAPLWSQFPATQSVDIADNDISNVDTIELVNIIDSSGSSGTDTQLLSRNALGSVWIDQSDVIEKWSEYPATQTIDASGNDINNVKDINISGVSSSIYIDNTASSTTLVNLPNITISTNVVVVFASPINQPPWNIVGAGNPVQVNQNTANMLQGVTYYLTAFSTQLGQLTLNPDGTGVIDGSDLVGLPQPILAWVDSSGPVVPKTNVINGLTITMTNDTDVSVLSATDLTFNGIPYNRNMVNSSLIYSSAAIYADSTYPPATNLLIRNTYGYSGWAFVNTALNSKFNYYFAPQSPTTTVADIKGISFNYFNVTQTSNDAQIFCTIYTKPQPGDVTFYHSKRNYIFDQSITPTINTPYQACIFVDKSLISYYYETQIQYELDPLNQVGLFLPTEEVLSITLSSSSSTPAGTMSVVLQKLNIIMDGFTKEFLLVSP
jgi:hypothetical protein